MKVQRLIEKYKELYENVFDFRAKLACQLILQDLEQLDEPSKVKVPQFVADWIENSKQEKRNLRNALNNGSEKMRLWFLDQENYDLFARAWLDGYEVEKEKRYFVKITAAEQYLVKVEDENFLGFLQSRLRSKFTRKELEDAGFGWVFSCEGIEIEEVE